MTNIRFALAASLATVLTACLPTEQTRTYAVDDTAPVDEEIGFRLPAGFKATVFADNLGFARHVTVREDGVVYVALRRAHEGKGIVALKDDDGDNVADQIEYFGDMVGTGIDLHDGHLYYGTNTEVVRFSFEGDEMVPTAEPEVMISGFLEQRQHAAKPFTFDGMGHIYVNIGAPSNACMEKARTKGSPGLTPCPQLDLQAGIWQFDANRAGQVHGQDGVNYATGIRNAMALDWNKDEDALFFIFHGRDQLSQLFPEHFNDAQNAEQPSEEFHTSKGGTDHGWPYSYWNHEVGKRMMGPEYGGDGAKETDGDFEKPLLGFPGHWAPNDLLFYNGRQFPDAFTGGAFIGFHGSWNRAPLPQRGYNIIFAPFENGKPTGDWSVFADGFPGADPLDSPRNARFRPMGLANGPDGSLFITDSMKGRVWKVEWVGE